MKSHCNFEKLYHPLYYKTHPCDELFKKKTDCKRAERCAFFHSKREKRDGKYEDSKISEVKKSPRVLQKLSEEHWEEECPQVSLGY